MHVLEKERSISTVDTSVEPASDNRLIQRLYGRNEYLYPLPHNNGNCTR